MSQAATGGAPLGGHWIRGRAADLLWLVGCPAAAWLSLEAVWAGSGWSDRNLYAVMFCFVVTAHHMPACIRAFGEPAIYRRYKARLWTALLFIPILAVMPFALGWGVSVLCIVALFDLWHVAMQQHGLGRIYAAKVGERDAHSARLDLACILVWYAAVVLLSDAWMAGLSEALRAAGLPIFDAISQQVFQSLRLAWLALSLALLWAYVRNAVAVSRRGGRVAWLKHALHGVAFGVLAGSYQDTSWYRAQSTQNLFHALQYFFIVWVYGNLSVRRQPLQYPQVYAGLFRNKRGIMRFALLVLLYGLLFYILRVARTGLQLGALTAAQVPLLPREWSAEHAMEMLASASIASVLLHFYVDSFIWKVRSTPVQAALGIEPATGQPAVQAQPIEATPRGILHALLYFGLPLALVAVVGAGRRQPQEAVRTASLLHDANLFPNSAAAHAAAGKAAAERGDLSIAASELGLAVALAPSYEGPARTLADMARQQGRTAEALGWGRRALRATPEDANLRYQLALDLIAASRPNEARDELRRVVAQRRGFNQARDTLAELEQQLADER